VLKPGDDEGVKAMPAGEEDFDASAAGGGDPGTSSSASNHKAFDELRSM